MVTSYVQLRPCVDSSGHKFSVSRPPAGDFGYAITYCTRCGFDAKELRL